MILHQPEINTKDGHTIVWARLELNTQPENFPEFLWYRVPEHYSNFLSLQSDAFLIPGLLAGMYHDEIIEVRGTVSPHLAYQLEEYQHLLSFRYPKILHKVDIKYSRIKPIDSIPKGVGSTFSGGVDSLFTLLKHIPQNQINPDYQISHALFIDGFDILISNRTKYQKLFPIYQNALKEINVELVSLETNIVNIIIPRMEYVYFCGPILGGCAHIFGGIFSKFFISSSYDYHRLKSAAFSSDPLIDTFLSTDSTEIIHHGSTHQRVEKVEAISNWELAQRILRVCSNSPNPEELVNCGRCEKCVRTMIPLYAMGKMSKFKTFAKPLSKNSEGLWWARKFNPAPGFNFIAEMFPFIKNYKPDFLPWLRAAAFLGYLRFWLLKLLPEFIKTWLQSFGYFIDPIEAANAFENPEILKLICETYDTPST